MNELIDRVLRRWGDQRTKPGAVVPTIGSHRQAVITIDYTHVGRRASGIERITVEQFNKVALLTRDTDLRDTNKRLAFWSPELLGLPLHAITNTSSVLLSGLSAVPYFATYSAIWSILFMH